MPQQETKPSPVKHITQLWETDGRVHLTMPESVLNQMGWDRGTEVEIMTFFGGQMLVRKKDSLKG